MFKIKEGSSKDYKAGSEAWTRIDKKGPVILIERTSVHILGKFSEHLDGFKHQGAEIPAWVVEYKKGRFKVIPEGCLTTDEPAIPEKRRLVTATLSSALIILFCTILSPLVILWSIPGR